MAIQLDTGLIRATRTAEAIGARAQHRAHVAQARRPIPFEQMSINPRHLRGHIGTHTHHAATQLVGELEGLQFQIITGPGQQRFEKFDQWRHDQLVTPARVQINQSAA